MSTPKQSYYLINKGIKNWWCVLFYFLSKQKKFLKITQNLYICIGLCGFWFKI